MRGGDLRTFKVEKRGKKVLHSASPGWMNWTHADGVIHGTILSPQRKDMEWTEPCPASPASQGPRCVSNRSTRESWPTAFLFYYGGAAYWGGQTFAPNGTEFLPGDFQVYWGALHTDKALAAATLAYVGSFGFAARLKLDTFGFNRLCAYRGTPLWQEYVQRGIIDDARDLDKWFKCSDIDPTPLPSARLNRLRMKGYALLIFFPPHFRASPPDQ